MIDLVFFSERISPNGALQDRDGTIDYGCVSTERVDYIHRLQDTYFRSDHSRCRQYVRFVFLGRVYQFRALPSGFPRLY